jgi:hypothetical protein
VHELAAQKIAGKTLEAGFSALQKRAFYRLC